VQHACRIGVVRAVMKLAKKGVIVEVVHFAQRACAVLVLCANLSGKTQRNEPPFKNPRTGLVRSRNVSGLVKSNFLDV
jgi:hypothetical protein